jgi:beta-N-acetylglucosaminidase
MMLAHTLRIQNSDRIQRIYDIKGSTVKREIKMTENTSRTKTLKDINFLKLKKKEPLDLIEIDQLFVIR